MPVGSAGGSGGYTTVDGQREGATVLTTIIFVALLGVLVTGLGTWLVARRAAPRPPTTSTGRRPNGNGPPGSTPPARSTDGPVAGHHTPGPTTDAPGKYDK